MCLILTVPQAMGLFKAACILTNAGGKMTADFKDNEGRPIRVFERSVGSCEKPGAVRVVKMASHAVFEVVALEDYVSWEDFGTSYNLIYKP